MRLVTWNCYRSPWQPKIDAISRLRPDVVVLTECARPPLQDGRQLRWFGHEENPLGITVVTTASYSVHPFERDR